jgi:chemotaxis protein CheZ
MKIEDLAALAPAEGVVTSPEVFQQIGAITRLLHDTMQQLGVMPKLQTATEGLPDARSRLNYIANKTSDAANKVLNSVEHAKSEHHRISADTRALATALTGSRTSAWASARC